MIRVVMAGVSIVGVFYSCVALAGYLAFPDTARSNITLNFRQDDWLMQVRAGVVGVMPSVSARPNSCNCFSLVLL